MENLEVQIPRKIYIYNTPINMGCGFDKLPQMVKEGLKRKPDTGDLFLFVNKKRNYLKVLSYVNTGWIIVAKRLTAGKFNELDGCKVMTPAELQTYVDAVVEDKLLLEN